MLDDVVKFLIKFFEKNIDNFFAGTSRFWDNFLVRVATTRAMRFIIEESNDGEVVLQSWVLPVILLLSALTVLSIVLVRRLQSKRKNLNT